MQKVKYIIFNNLYIVLVENLIERNKSYWKIKHTNDIIRLQKASDRHNKNMFEEQKKREQKVVRDEEKMLKKYMTFYYYRKGKEKELKFKKSKNQHKLMEKSEKLEEIDKQEKLKTKELILKMDTIERKKNEILKHKNDELLKFRQKRNNYNNICQIKKQNLVKELSDIRLDILDYQSCILQRDMEKMKMATLKKTKSTERTLNDQINLKKNIVPFFKKLEIIKSENVMRKSVKDRRKIYLEKKRQEAERRKREEEEELIYMNLK